MRGDRLSEKKSGSSVFLLLIGGGCVVVSLGCIACGGIGVWFFWPSAGAADTIEGTWEYTGQALPANVRTVKLMVGNQFINVNYDRNRKIMLLMSGGTYSLDGNAFKERIEFSSPGIQEMLLGKEQSFTLRRQADAMAVTGVLSNGVPIDESWRRIGAASPPDKRAAHEGLWEDTSAAGDVRSVKLIVGQQFASVAYDRKRKTSVNMGGGSFIWKGQDIEQTFEYCSLGPTEKLLGQKFTLAVTLQGDQMNVTGVLAMGVKVNETWRRIK